MRVGTAIIGALLLCLASSPPTHAQTNISARVLWYGLFTGEPKIVDDPTSPTGRRLESTPVPPQTNSTLIPARGLNFGVGYVLEGAATGTPVNIKHVWRFPPGGMPDTPGGGVRTTYEYTFSYTVGKSSHVGWTFTDDAPAQTVRGVWTMEVWVGGRKLLDQRFTVGP